MVRHQLARQLWHAPITGWLNRTSAASAGLFKWMMFASHSSASSKIVWPACATASSPLAVPSSAKSVIISVQHSIAATLCLCAPSDKPDEGREGEEGGIRVKSRGGPSLN